jgi:hypothetical protein
MYRLALFSTVYGRFAAESDAEEEEELESKIEEYQKRSKDFFDCFTTPELREMQRVEVFLREILAGISDDHPESLTGKHEYYHWYSYSS